MFIVAHRNGTPAARASAARGISAGQNRISEPQEPASHDADKLASRRDAPPATIAPVEPYRSGASPSSGFRPARDLSDWKVLPHHPIQRLTENLWRVEGDLGHFGLRRVMTVARLSDGRLVVHGAIALDEGSMQAIEEWGSPAYLLVPHTRHCRDAKLFKKRYPEIRVLATRGALRDVDVKDVKGVKDAMSVDGTYEDFPEDDSVQLRLLRGCGGKEGAMIVRSRDGVSVVLNEIVCNLPRPEGFAERAAMRLLGFGPGPRVTSVAKAELVDDAEALRADLEHLSTLPGLVRLVVSHHVMALGCAAPLCLQLAARSL
jgi:hypothetical protein